MVANPEEIRLLWTAPANVRTQTSRDRYHENPLTTTKPIKTKDRYEDAGLCARSVPNLIAYRLASRLTVGPRNRVVFAAQDRNWGATKRGRDQNALRIHQLGKCLLLESQGKTRKARRQAPLSERVIALLRTVQQEQSVRKEGWIFPSTKSASGHIELSGIEHMFWKTARKVGIPDALKLYCARHTFGTVAMAETRNPGLVKEVMGHESLNTTMGYLHPETAQIKAVIDRVNQQKSQPQKEPQWSRGMDGGQPQVVEKVW